MPFPIFIRGLEERLCQYDPQKLMEVYMHLWDVHNFNTITLDELYRCAEFPLTLWRILIKLGLADYECEETEAEIKQAKDEYKPDWQFIEDKEKEVHHMKDIVEAYEEILAMVDDGTRTSMYNPLSIEEIGDPNEAPKLIDWQDAIDAKGIYRKLALATIGNKNVTDLEGARKFLIDHRVQHILQRTAWFPFNVSHNICKDQATEKKREKGIALDPDEAACALDDDFADFYTCFCAPKGHHIFHYADQGWMTAHNAASSGSSRSCWGGVAEPEPVEEAPLDEGGVAEEMFQEEYMEENQEEDNEKNAETMVEEAKADSNMEPSEDDAVEEGADADESPAPMPTFGAR